MMISKTDKVPPYKNPNSGPISKFMEWDSIRRLESWVVIEKKPCPAHLTRDYDMRCVWSPDSV